jgi:hypothetical protein
MASMMTKISYSGYRFPPVIIQQAIWLYARFSFRDVEDVLAERGIAVSYETVRRWVNHFGSAIAADLRKRPTGRPRSQEPPVRRIRRRSRAMGRRRLVTGHRQAQQRRAVRLSQGRSGTPVQRPCDERPRRPAPLELGAVSRCSGLT